MKLEELRKKVNLIDSQILKLLNRRAEIVKKINEEKEKRALDIFSPEREAQILKRLKKENKGVLKDSDIELIFKEIFSVFRALKVKLRISYLGPEGTFTHLAAVKRFGKRVRYISCESIREVFDSVEKEISQYGVVPVENSIEGVVNYTLDMFFESDLKICSEIIMHIQHQLLARASSLNVKRIYSNPQVFAQCRKWLVKNMPSAALIPVASTAQAAHRAKEDPQGACIGDKILASLYGLQSIASDIQDSLSNVTRFLVISKKDSPPSGDDKTSIIFSVKDKIGALHDALYSFKKFGINLTKIESRPSKRKAWEYYFFVDFQGHREDVEVKKSLEELEKKCNFVKLLGSYARQS